MIKAKHQFFLYHFFKLYGLWLIQKNFDHVEIKGDFQEKGKPILIISNHISWWDGFWVVYFRQKIVKRKFYFMMLEEQLRKNIFLKYAGGYSIQKGSRTILETIRYTQEVLQNPNNMVLLFPQGKIESQHQHDIHFEKGISKIIEKCPDAQILFMAHFTDYFSERKPTLTIHFKEFSKPILNHEELELQYNQFFTLTLTSQIQKSE
jgi:1-acyl-sn-glycerol-3-phosphate acyltransferase